MPVISISDDLAQNILASAGWPDELVDAVRLATERFAIPANISDAGRRALAELMAVAREFNDGELSGGVDRPFVHPSEWTERYGRDSEVVVIHDGGPFAPILNWDYCAYDQIEALRQRLEPLGMFAEQCTCWYSAIYVA